MSIIGVLQRNVIYYTKLSKLTNTNVLFLLYKRNKYLKDYNSVVGSNDPSWAQRYAT